MLPQAWDWQFSFVPAVQVWLAGLNPYDGSLFDPLWGFFNPPWILPILAPFALLPYEWGRALFLVVSLGAFVFAAYRLGGKWPAVLAFILSPLVVNGLHFGNVESLSVLGLAIGGPVGILLASLKPQMTIAVILFWMLGRWQSQRWAGLVRLLALPAVAGVLSVLFFPAWLPKLLSYPTHGYVPVFPYGVPVGVLFAFLAFRTRRAQYAVAASPFFFPTINTPVWSVVPLALVSDTRAMLISSILSWLFMFWH